MTECSYCDKPATETVRHKRKTHPACRSCAAWVIAAEYARKVLQ